MPFLVAAKQAGPMSEPRRKYRCAY